MQQEDDIRGLALTIEFMRAVSILFCLIHVYWYCYPMFRSVGLTLQVLDDILLSFDRTAGLFHSPLYTKGFALLLLMLSCLGTGGVKDPNAGIKTVICCLTVGGMLFFGADRMAKFFPLPYGSAVLYICCLAAGYVLLLLGGIRLGRMIHVDTERDPFNNENESFRQEERLITNACSVNLPTRYKYGKRWRGGWINIVNPFRATIVLGTPGSGKSYAVVNSFIRQQIGKGYAMYLYDYKFDDLSVIALNTLRRCKAAYKVTPKFCVINFDNPRKSHRCNPLNPKFMTDISDAYESAYTILLNLNRTWVQKQGDFFVESPIILLTAVIWYLRIYREGVCCTLPHAIELLNRPYADLFPVLTAYPELENYLSPFMDAWKGGAAEQLQGQIASAKIPLSRLISPALYWVMSGDDFSLDINNPKEPKILCVGNNPDRQNIYSAALGLYNARIMKLINKKGMLKCSVIIDELPTIYFRGLDNLIATARSNKVAVCLGFQDFSQLRRDYGDKEAAVVMNTAGNIFSGQVVGETAKNLSERFGRISQKRRSETLNRNDRSVSVSTQLDTLIPPSKIATLTQGMFVGAVSDNIDERIEQKIFHAEILVDKDELDKEAKNRVPIPQLADFTDSEGNDRMNEVIEANYKAVKEDVKRIVSEELERIQQEAEIRKQLRQNSESLKRDLPAGGKTAETNPGCQTSSEAKHKENNSQQ